MNEQQIQVLKDAISKYSPTSQLDMATEECAELIQAINKVKRSGLVQYHITKPNLSMHLKTALTYHNLCSEVADVKIMIAQLELMLDTEIIQISFDRKIARLEERLK